MRDVAVGVHRLEVQQLRHDVVGRRVVDLHAEEDDALLEQLRSTGRDPRAAAGALDERRQDRSGLRLRLRGSSAGSIGSQPVIGVASGDRRRSGTWLALRDDVVDEAVLLRLLGGEPAVAVGVLLDLLDRLAGVEGDALVQHPAWCRASARPGSRCRTPCRRCRRRAGAS